MYFFGLVQRTVMTGFNFQSCASIPIKAEFVQVIRLTMSNTAYLTTLASIILTCIINCYPHDTLLLTQKQKTKKSNLPRRFLAN